MAAKKRTVVLNLRDLPKTVSEPLYIGRGSYWGNPYTIGKDGDRATVLAKYKRRLWSDKAMMARLPELRGRSLLCFCSPQGCHGHVLVKALAWLDSQPAVAKVMLNDPPTAAEIEAGRAKRRAALKAAHELAAAHRAKAPSADQAEDLLIAAGL